MTPPGLIELPRDLVEPAVGMYGRTFFDDPQTMYFAPDEAARRQAMPHVFRLLIRYTTLYGRAQATSSDLEGLACWLPFPKARMRTWGLWRAGALALGSRVGRDVMDRLRRVQEYAGRIHHRVVPGPHWYLVIMGVDPDFQSRGWAEALLRPMLTRLDELGRPCFLETHRADNVSFYRRFGFEVAETGALPGSDIPHWAMLRWP
ncbi:MAG: GNAT family N-acetyltransferase [Proteobacteria bacterium]|nr:GNAT family N-acetyltransferase [Pseudomonadota bacterium]MBU1740979.1 GNAT family N-acetyltransferase [Pseudomonadota bacterium]